MPQEVQDHRRVAVFPQGNGQYTIFTQCDCGEKATQTGKYTWHCFTCGRDFVYSLPNDVFTNQYSPQGDTK